MWSFAMALSLGIAGCNLFHPTDSRDAESDDPEALTLDGYIEFQNSNFSKYNQFVQNLYNNIEILITDIKNDAEFIFAEKFCFSIKLPYICRGKKKSTL